MIPESGASIDAIEEIGNGVGDRFDLTLYDKDQLTGDGNLLSSDVHSSKPPSPDCSKKHAARPRTQSDSSHIPVPKKRELSLQRTRSTQNKVISPKPKVKRSKSYSATPPKSTPDDKSGHLTLNRRHGRPRQRSD